MTKKYSNNVLEHDSSNYISEQSILIKQPIKKPFLLTILCYPIFLYTYGNNTVNASQFIKMLSSVSVCIYFYKTDAG